MGVIYLVARRWSPSVALVGLAISAINPDSPPRSSGITTAGPWRRSRRQPADNGRAFGIYLLRVLRTGSVPRAATLRYGIGTWASWLVGRIVRRLRGKEPLPMTLLWAELGGAATAPPGFVTTYWKDRFGSSGVKAPT